MLSNQQSRDGAFIRAFEVRRTGGASEVQGRRPETARRVRAFRPALEPGGLSLEERCLLAVTFSHFPTNATNAYPEGITSGPGGNLWFTLDNGSDQPNAQIGSINPTTKQVNIIQLTHGSGNLGGITADSSGDLWFLDVASSLVEEYNPSTQASHEQSLPADGGSLGDIVYGPNRAIWVANPGTDALDEVDTQTLAVTPFTAPNGLQPNGLAVGPDNALWFTTGTSTIGRFDPVTSTFQTFTVPNSNSATDGIAAGPNNLLYFTDTGADAIGVIAPAGSASSISEFPIPAQFINIFLGNSGLSQGITAGADGNVWFTLTAQFNEIGSFNPTTKAINVFSDANDPNARSEGIALGSDGNLWFTDFGAGNIVQAVSTGGSGSGGGGGGTSPTIMNAQDSFQTITTGKGKHSRHKSQFDGFTLTFNEALDPATARNLVNYKVLVKSKHRRKTITKPIGFKVAYTAGSDTVTILTGKQTFAQGGKLTVNASPPDGITDPTDSFFLTGNTTFTISPKARSISP